MTTKLHRIRFVVEVLCDLQTAPDKSKRVIIKKDTIFEGAQIRARVIEQGDDLIECARIRIDDGVLADVPYSYFRFE